MMKVLTLALALAAFTLTSTFASDCGGGSCKKEDAKPAPTATP
jgi:hypothetical protein